MTVRLLLAALLLIVTVGAAASAWVVGAPSMTSDQVAAVPATSVLSVRRVPSLVAEWRADAQLGRALDAALRASDARSCLAVERGDRPVYAASADDSFTPASTMKVLTAMAALRRLGADYSWTTSVVAESAVTDGVIDGPIYLIGGGDPLVATAEYVAWLPNAPQPHTSLERLAAATIAAGVREVRGGVVGDDGRYDDERHVATWKPGYLDDNDIGPVSALNVNDGLVRFRPEPAAAADPAANAASIFATLLNDRGVTVGAAARSGPAPASGATLAAVESRSGAEVVAQMLRESDNLTAEMLVKELGYVVEGEGSWAAGLEVVRSTLEEASVPVSAFTGVDGSGLDRANRLSCSMLMEALDVAGAEGPVADGFAVAGRSGTLRPRFRGTPAEGRLRAKTGSLNNVAALAGFVHPPEQPHGAAGPRPPLEFALVANDLPDRLTSGRRLQAQIGTLLAAHEPPAEALVVALGPRAA